MKNLLKNVIRSFKNNKISIIGLVFLLFFGLGVFATMSNTTANIRNEYTSLAERGKLHDFTASELYDVGSAVYLPYTKGISYKYTNGQSTPYTDWQAFSFVNNPDEHIRTLPTTELYPGDALPVMEGDSPALDGTYYVPIPEQTIFGNYEELGTTQTVIRTYHLILDKDSSSGLYKDFALNHPNSEYVDFYFRSIKTYEPDPWTYIPTIPQRVIDYQQILDKWNTQGVGAVTIDNIRELAGDSSLGYLYSVSSLFSDDYQDFVKEISEHTQNVFSIMSTTDTPLANRLNGIYSNEVDYRFFKSINVTATEDKIYYKIIESNPTDKIDSMVLFSDANGRYGNQLFPSDSWQPYDSEIKIYDLDDKEIAPGTKFDLPNGETLTIPENFNEVVEVPIYDPELIRTTWKDEEGKIAKYIYSQILHIRFKRMFAGDRSTNKLDECLFNLAGITLDKKQYALRLFSRSSVVFKALQEYYLDWYGAGGESITISSNGNVVFSWVESLGTPQTCTISNWTSRFSIINPQHIEKSDKRVIEPWVLNNFEPYKQWYKSVYKVEPRGEINQAAAAQWFNTLTQDQFSFWINPSTKDWKSMSYYTLESTDPIVVKAGTGPGEWSGIDKRFIAECGGYNQIIWGCGLTPDFMYPVVDITRPTPNTATECLVYCNDAGYQTIKLAFVNSTIEEYLIARFKPGVNSIRRQEIVNEINTWANDYMIFPDGVKSAYFADDTSNLLNCSGFRVSYIPNLVNVIQIVVAILCSFIGILCLIICFVIIKRYVENNRVNIGIMRANGIKKWKIGLSMLPFALFPAVIGGIAAYVTGLFLQTPALSLFKNYWMLPTPLIQFDWVSFLASIFLPFIVFGLICFITTLLVLRVSSVELMKSGSEFKTNSFSRIAKKPFKHFGILTRFRVALAFNSISRLLMLAAMSCLTMSSLVFAFTTFDKLNSSRITNSTQFDYSFNVQLTTPTASGSVYSTYDYSSPIDNEDNTLHGFGWSDPSQYIFNAQWNTTNWSSLETRPAWATDQGKDYYAQLTKWYAWESMPDFLVDPGYYDAVADNGNLMIPSMTDSSGQNLDLLYLQNKLCSRLTLDYNIGIPEIASSNPWEIALALMPANSRNIAADSFNTITNLAGHKIHEATTAFLEKAKAANLHINEYGHVYADEGLDDVEETRNKIKTILDQLKNKWFSNYEWYELGTYYWKNVFENYFLYDKDSDTYRLNTDIGTVGYLGASFQTSFVKLIRTIYKDKELMELEYPITYGNVPLNWDKGPDDKKDETYTYITANINELSNGRRFDPTEEITIEGICQDSQFIKLTDNDDNDLNSWLFSENYVNSLRPNDLVHPMVANAYAAHKYKLKVGDTISIIPNNTVDRYERMIHPNKYKEDDNKATFVIVGISKGTNNAAFYTTQPIANEILGLPDGRSWNKTHKYMMWSDTDWGTTPSTLPQLIDLAGVGGNYGKATVYKFTNMEETQFSNVPVIDTESVDKLQLPTPVGFNGIYTENTSGKPITAGLSLYSYTGMYPGTSVYQSNGNNKFSEVLSSGANLAIASLMTGITDKEDKVNYFYDLNAKYLRGEIPLAKYRSTIEDEFVPLVTSVYGDTTMVTAICGAMDVAASDLIYSNLISTFNLAETSVMAIIIPITIIIVAIISSLIINDSRRMAAMLKALGYSDAKNLMSILALFVPTIIIGLGLAVPLAFGLTLGYQSIIFSSANILIDVTQKWWYYVAAIGGIGVILIGTYAIGYVSIKRARLVDEIK